MLDWNFIASQIATIAFDIVYFGAIIGTIVVIILDNRNPVKTMAWILILMFLPIVGLVFYFFFGRSPCAHDREEELQPLVEETYGGISGAGLMCASHQL